MNPPWTLTTFGNKLLLVCTHFAKKKQIVCFVSSKMFALLSLFSYRCHESFRFLLILYYTTLQGFGFVFLSLSSSDFDECSLEPNPCDNNADCRNNEGSYTCACKLGYSGDGAACQGIL